LGIRDWFSHTINYGRLSRERSAERGNKDLDIFWNIFPVPSTGTPIHQGSAVVSQRYAGGFPSAGESAQSWGFPHERLTLAQPLRRRYPEAGWFHTAVEK